MIDILKVVSAIYHVMFFFNVECVMDRPQLFKVLKRDYAPAFSKDPSLKEYVDVCGAKYFGAALPQDASVTGALRELFD
jgi:hypothetical protein